MITPQEDSDWEDLSFPSLYHPVTLRPGPPWATPQVGSGALDVRMGVAARSLLSRPWVAILGRAGISSVFFLFPDARFPVPMASGPPGMCGTILVPLWAAAVVIDYLFLVPSIYFCSLLAPRTSTSPLISSACVCWYAHLLVRRPHNSVPRYASTQSLVYGPVLTYMDVSVSVYHTRCTATRPYGDAGTWVIVWYT